MKERKSQRRGRGREFVLLPMEQARDYGNRARNEKQKRFKTEKRSEFSGSVVAAPPSYRYCELETESENS